MKSTEWPKTEVKAATEGTGKPAEVGCAQAFLAAGWTARLGSYYADGALDVPRELDVLAVKETPPLGPAGPIIRVRALVACRGFPPERAPLTYSVSSSIVPPFEPRFLSAHRSSHTRPGARTNIGAMVDLERAGADRFLAATLEDARPVVALDILEREAPKNQPKAAPTVQRAKGGDARLFSAFDSALKAALFWMAEDYKSQTDSMTFATLNVPVCLLSVPFWDVCIDPGTTAEPTLRSRAYQSGLYPERPIAREILTLVWTQDELPALVAGLDDLFTWFVGVITAETDEGVWPKRPT